MKKDFNKIDYEWLTCPTGDPFADIGGYVIKYLQEREPDKDILELIEEATLIYVNNWEGKLHSFFHGSKITNPSIKTNTDKIDSTIKLFSQILNDVVPFEEGCCRISGRKTKLYSAGRESLILSGSGSFINFHHFFQSGLMLSKEILIRMFFIPLGSILLNGKIAIVHSNNPEITEFYVIDNCKNNLNSIGLVVEAGVLKSEFHNPANALFNFIDKAISNVKLASDVNTPISLTLYLFSNFGASTEMNVYRVPAKVFGFYRFCTRGEYRDDWQKFVYSHYSNSGFKGAKYNLDGSIYEFEKKGEINSIGFDDFKIWTNRVYLKLLNDQSLIPEFLRWSKTHKFNFVIIETYQIFVRNMKKETVTKIKDLAKYLVKDQNADAIKKRITSLNGAKNSYLLRRYFLSDVIAKNYNEGGLLMISVDDYVNYLFSDDISWQEIRDLLLIAIYQELHELKLNVVIELPEPEITEIEQQ
jgi:CRISPR-associated protein Cst1